MSDAHGRSLALILIAALAIAPQSFAADPEPPCLSWIKSHLAPLRSIDPADENFEDMAPLKAAIGDSSLVLLSEQDHGDGRTFLAKGRVVKFLHEQMGFDVLVWESGLYDCTLAEAALARAEVPVPEAAAMGLHEAWATARQVMPAMEYVRATHATPRPLILAGMDVQLSGKDAGEALATNLRAVLDRLGDNVVSADEWQKFVDALAARKAKAMKMTEHCANAERTISVVEKALEDAAATQRAGLDEQSVRLWRQTLVNLRLQFQLVTLLQNRASFRDFTNFRDQAMADNVVWLRERAYPGRKMIIWTSSSHALRGSAYQQPVEGEKVMGIVPTGEVLYKKLKDEVYAIAFVATEGQRANTVKPVISEVKLPGPATLDASLAAAGPDQFFLDLRSARHDMEACIVQAWVGGMLKYRAIEAPWPHVCDAFLFIRRQEPAARIDAPTPAAAEPAGGQSP